MCVSFGVMLPVGNPPNAIVFSYGHVQISDMVRHSRRHKVTCASAPAASKGWGVQCVKVILCNQRGWGGSFWALTSLYASFFFQFPCFLLISSRWKQDLGWTWSVWRWWCWPSPHGGFPSSTWLSSQPGRWPGTSLGAYNPPLGWGQWEGEGRNRWATEREKEMGKCCSE